MILRLERRLAEKRQSMRRTQNMINLPIESVKPQNPVGYAPAGAVPTEDTRKSVKVQLNTPKEDQAQTQLAIVKKAKR